MLRREMTALVFGAAISCVGFADDTLADERANAQLGPTFEIEHVCGDGALRIVGTSTLPEGLTSALDLVLKGFVTSPINGSGVLSVYSPKPPLPGAVALVSGPQGSYLRAIGVADVASCSHMDPRMTFAIGSNTKMFTAAIIYQLSEEGKLSTSDLVSLYLPEEIAMFPRVAGATIENLLGHTSGLPDYLNVQSADSIGARDQTPEGIVQGFTPSELVAEAASHQDDPDQPEFAPGERGQWSYSNTGYIMLGQIIEKVTGKSFEQVLTERILEPLGMSHTRLIGGMAAPGLNLPSSYLASPFDFDTSRWNYSQAWSAGAIVSTPVDMARFLRTLFKGELFRREDTLMAMIARAAPGYPGQTSDYFYGHGSFFKGGFYGHGGQTLGFESDVGYDPKRDITVVAWGNASEGYSGQGVLLLGSALGITPSLDDIVRGLIDAELAHQSEGGNP